MLLDKIIKKLTSSIQHDQWKSSFVVIKWFKDIKKNKNKNKKIKRTVHLLYSIFKTCI